MNKSDLDALAALDTATNTPSAENNASSADPSALTKSYSSDSSAGSYQSNEHDEADETNGSKPGAELDTSRIKHLELELARVKLELVDAQCKNQEFDHRLKGYENNREMKSGSNEQAFAIDSMTASMSSLTNNSRSINASNGSINSSSGNVGNSWLSKTFTQFKEAKNQVVLKAQKVKTPSTEFS